MHTVKFSSLPELVLDFNLEQIIDYLLDNNYKAVIFDNIRYSPTYELCDIHLIWDLIVERD